MELPQNGILLRIFVGETDTHRIIALGIRVSDDIDPLHLSIIETEEGRNIVYVARNREILGVAIAETERKVKC